MIAVRALAFAFFLLVAVGLVAWQVRHLGVAVAESSSQATAWMAIGFGFAILAAQFIGMRLLRKRDTFWVVLFAGAPLLPLTGLVGGIISLIQARGGQHRRIWEGVLTVGALLGLNVALPLGIGIWVVRGSDGLMWAWTAIQVVFFLVVNYYLGRAILHYFASGASAFVSLRYLRRRVLSLLSVLGIALGVLALILVNSVMNGFQRDFREQLRGSQSHLLVRFDSMHIDARIDHEEARQAEWATWVNRLEANPQTAGAWQDALDLALHMWRSENDALDPPPGDGGGPGLPGDDEPEDQPALSEAERSLLERLRTGRGLQPFHREYLRQGGVIVTPREIYLSKIADLGTSEGRALARDTADIVKRDWYAPLFRRALQQEFDRAAEALQQHTDPMGRHDVEGISPRVMREALITPRRGSRRIQTVQLVGVDPEHETEISRLGDYVANAEIHVFREQYVLGPLANLLGATLGWEHPDSAEQSLTPPPFRFTEDGGRTGRVYTDLSRYLAMRGLALQGGRIAWSEFDRIEYLEFSPGRQLYSRVKRAHRQASRSDDLAQLGRILHECERDVRAILQPLAAAPETDVRHEAIVRTGARVLLFEFLTSAGVSVDAIQLHNHHVVGTIDYFIREDGDYLSETEREALHELWERLNEHTRSAQSACNDPGATEAQREQAVLDMANTYLAELDSAVAAARAAGRTAVASRLSELRDSLSPPETIPPMRERLRRRLALSLSFAAENYANAAEAAAQRIEAYRKVLPLRATMTADDSVKEYVQRATTPGARPQNDRPGIILGDALAEAALGAGVAIGDSIAVTVPRVYYDSAEGSTGARTTEVWFEVTGFFRSGLHEENRTRMYCDFDELTTVLADSDIEYTLGARLEDYSIYEGDTRSRRLKAEIQRGLDEVGSRRAVVSVWEDESRTLMEAVNIERALIGLIVSFIIALTGGVIFILVYQLVNEKVKDIGILKALGYSPWGVRSVFMFNALFIGLFGALIGGAAGMLMSQNLPAIEDFIYDFTGWRLFSPEIYFLTNIPSLKGDELLGLALDVTAPVVLFSFLCGIYPALLAAKKDPVEALHYE